MRKIQLIVFLLLMLSATLVKAQGTGSIKGKVVDGNAKTIAAATITLVQAADTSLVKMSVADKEGHFVFDAVENGRYLVTITAIGHQPAYSAAFDITAARPSITLEPIELQPEAKAIGGVTVTARKPLVEMKAGKMLVNVDASPSNAGLNALEVLEKSPGVTVDNDGNISLKGKQGVLVLIDGKPTYMSGADLAAFLKSMQSSSLEQIEIMTNPPAKYDAAGNSGIINIKTKKGTIKGMNGNANAGVGQGMYNRYWSGVNLNYRNNKLNLFGGYNGGKYEGYNRLVLTRRLYEADKVTLARTIDQVSRPHYKGFYHNIKAGMDYNFTKKDVAGIVVNGNFGTNKEDPHSSSNLRQPGGSLISRLLSESDNSRRSFNWTTNVNYKHTFDSTGREFSSDFDQAYYSTRNNTFLHTTSLDPAGNHLGPVVSLKGHIPSLIRIYSVKADYVHPLSKQAKLETGAKASWVNTDNEVTYLRSNGGDWARDDRSNHFLYRENINAVYAILSGSIKKWELSAGLRLENTIAKGIQMSNDSSFRRGYTNLFPNMGISYALNSRNQLSLSYSRRITRPNYDDLNPFVFFLDSLTYGKGNPFLQPQFTNNIELSHTFNRFLTTTLNYTQTNDVITEMLKQNTAENVTYQTKENFNSMKQWGLAIMINAPVRKWWNTNIYMNAYNNHYSGIYQEDNVDIRFTSFAGNINNTFTLGKGWGAELSGWYRSRATEGLLVINGLGSLNAGVTKQVMNKKGTFRFSARDILFTQKVTGYVKYSDVDVTLGNRRDTRQVSLSFTYRFGKNNIAPERRRNSGAADEQNRVKSGN